jgi:multidrug efflux system membrane fusion protein
MSQQQVDTEAATVDQLEGTVRNDQAQIDNAKLQLVYCHITSPIDGRIGLRLVDPGNMVHATDQNLLLVITQQSVWSRSAADKSPRSEFRRTRLRSRPTD